MALRAAFPALLATGAHGCDIKFTNNAGITITTCLRHNGDAPGSVWSKELAPNSSATVGCRSGNGGRDSWQTYTTVAGGKCAWNNCTQNTGTCNYPWVLGQGVSSENGNWYGSVGANWDGAGYGYTGDYTKVGYGITLQCVSYKTQHVNAECTIGSKDGKPICTGTTPTPNYGRASSGVEMCDPGQTLQVTLTHHDAGATLGAAAGDGCSSGSCLGSCSVPGYKNLGHLACVGGKCDCLV